MAVIPRGAKRSRGIHPSPCQGVNGYRRSCSTVHQPLPVQGFNDDFGIITGPVGFRVGFCGMI
jgi:hypothetical protein